jgi:hypothetical protein
MEAGSVGITLENGKEVYTQTSKDMKQQAGETPGVKALSRICLEYWEKARRPVWLEQKDQGT